MFDGASDAPYPLLMSPADLPRWAERIAYHVQKMADGSHGRFEAGDIFLALEQGRFHAWLVMDGSQLLCVMLTEIIVYPRKRALRIVGLVGHRPLRWVRFLRAVEAAAKGPFGCDLIECLAQRRHLALMPDYRETHVLAEKVL